MLLLLIRHAIAAEPDPVRYPEDGLRPLLPKGRRIQRRMSARLFEEGLAPARVFSSPWKRAWQTARIVIEECGLTKADREACPALAEPPDLAAIAAQVGSAGGTGPIALVGHEPWMGSMAALLLTGSTGGVAVDYPKSGIMGIETGAIEPGAGVLQFFWRP